jgi:hypothetical protein
MQAQNWDREAWLTSLASLIQDDVLGRQGIQLDRYRVCLGFPPNSRKALARTLDRGQSKDGHAEIFISPEFGPQDAIKIAVHLTHEMLHATLDMPQAHAAPFSMYARLIGFERPYHKPIPSDRLSQQLANLVQSVGPLPHASITLPPSQPTRLLKITCSNHCGMVLRASSKQTKRFAPKAACPTNGCVGHLVIK